MITDIEFDKAMRNKSQRKYCLECGDKITKENYSHWCYFLCLPCDVIRRKRITKELEDIRESFDEKAGGK